MNYIGTNNNVFGTLCRFFHGKSLYLQLFFTLHYVFNNDIQYYLDSLVILSVVNVLPPSTDKIIITKLVSTLLTIVLSLPQDKLRLDQYTFGFALAVVHP